MARPLIFLDPTPRRRDTIFSPEAWAELHALGDVSLHADPGSGERAIDDVIGQVEFLVGQTSMPAERLARATKLRAIINVETNFLQNIDYAQCFARGIPVLTPSVVFAQPVAEHALGLCIDLGRGLTLGDRLFRLGRERYGSAGNAEALSLLGATVGLVGFGDLGRAFLQLITPFRCDVRIHDPWLPDLLIEEAGCRASSLDDLLAHSQFVIVFAAATSDNNRFIGRREFDLMQRGAAFVLMSRAAVVDFDAMIERAASGRLRVATDVYPVEPAPPEAAFRHCGGILLSAHRAGALPAAMTDIGRRAVADIKLMMKGAAPRACRRAEPETVTRMRSMTALDRM